MRRVGHLLAAVLMAILALVVGATPASAHTGFESSDPADGATLDAPLSVITLVFSGQAEPTGDGFLVLDPSGELREPTEAMTADGLTWELRFEPAIAGGMTGLRWMVKAPDAHPIDGSFSFTVNAPAPEPVPATPSPATEPEETESEASPLVLDQVPAELEPAPDAQPEAQASAATVPSAPEEPTVGDATPPEVEVDSSSATETALEAFLDTGDDPTAAARRIGAAGRMATLAGTLLGVGALVFAAAVLRGARRDVRHVLYWVRRAGLLVFLGAGVELAAQLVIEAGGRWTGVWSLSTFGAVLFSQFGIAVCLRLIGGAALASGARFEITHASQAPDPVMAIKELVGAGAGPPSDFWASEKYTAETGQPALGSEPFIHRGDHAWLPTAGSSGSMFGAIAVLMAHLFDGHTVTKGNRLLTALVDLVHVAAGAVWVGGVLMLTSVLWRRHRQGREPRALQLAVRFSVVATMALAAVGAAGLALTVIILDSPSELWATEWGRLLMLKTLFVAVAGAAGGYNHKILIPEMNRAPDNAALMSHFRTIITAEAVALLAVLVVTAFLMGAAS